MKQRPFANILLRRLGGGLVLVSVAACIFVLWPNRSPKESVLTPEQPAPPLARAIASESHASLAPASTTLATSPAVRPSPIKQIGSYQTLPPQCDLRAITETYLEVSRRSAIAEQQLTAIVEADPESKEVMGATISKVAGDLSFCALAQTFEDPHLRPMMLDNLQVPMHLQANLEFGTELVEGVEITFDDALTPEAQAARFKFAAPFYAARYKRLTAKFHLAEEITALLPDAIGATRVKGIIEEYMGERGWRFDEGQGRFIPDKS